MGPVKTDPDSSDETPNTSTVSIDTTTSPVSETEREPYFEPVVHLPEVKVRTNEEDEDEMISLRCKLFRYHNQETPAEWKERGTGDVKLLHHTERKTVRVLMRQDKTLKVRANHYVTPYMELKPNCNSDRAFVWSSSADFADEEVKQETFAIRFANVDHANLFKETFDEARGMVTVGLVKEKEKTSAAESKRKEDTESQKEKQAGEEVTKGLENLSVKDKETVQEVPVVSAQ